MSAERGIYDGDSEELLLKHQAHGVVVLIVGGIPGNGFSVSTVDPRFAAALPALLRDMADSIESQNAAGGGRWQRLEGSPAPVTWPRDGDGREVPA